MYYLNEGFKIQIKHVKNDSHNHICLKRKTKGLSNRIEKNQDEKFLKDVVIPTQDI